MTDIVFNCPEDVEEAFYKAFETANLEAMIAVWLDADYVECIHPMSHRLMGIAAIRDSWREIFKNSTDIEFATIETRQIKHKDIAIHVVNENLLVEGQRQIQILATNIYENTPIGWRMILHHASPSPKQANQITPRTVH